MLQANAIQTLCRVAFFYYGREKIMFKLLVLDNYDSFTYNLVQMFRNFPLDIDVVRSDRIELEVVESRKPDYILISPGPRDPAHAGISIPLIRRWHRHIPFMAFSFTPKAS